MQGRAPRRPRAEVEHAIVDGYLQIAASEGMPAATTRRVAAEVGVNPGLIHRYFGSRRALIGRLLDELVARLADEVDAEVDLGPDGPLALYTKILISAADEGLDPSEIQTSHPVIDTLLQRADTLGLAAGEARALAAQVFALYLGWQAFGSFTSRVAGLELASPEDQARQLHQAAWTLALAAHQRSERDSTPGDPTEPVPAPTSTIRARPGTSPFQM